MATLQQNFHIFFKDLLSRIISGTRLHGPSAAPTSKVCAITVFAARTFRFQSKETSWPDRLLHPTVSPVSTIPSNRTYVLFSRTEASTASFRLCALHAYVPLPLPLQPRICSYYSNFTALAYHSPGGWLGNSIWHLF